MRKHSYWYNPLLLAALSVGTLMPGCGGDSPATGEPALQQQVFQKSPRNPKGAKPPFPFVAPGDAKFAHDTGEIHNGLPVRDGFAHDARWTRFSREWTDILDAKTPQDFEDAVNRHPLADKTHWHKVAGLFGKNGYGKSARPRPPGVNDCHNNQDFYKNNMGGASIYEDNMGNDTYYTMYLDAASGGNWWLVQLDGALCQALTVTGMTASVDSYITNSLDNKWFAGLQTDGNLFVYDNTNQQVVVAASGGTTSVCTASGSCAAPVTDSSGQWNAIWLDSQVTPMAVYYADNSGATGKVAKTTIAGPSGGVYTVTNVFSTTLPQANKLIHSGPLVTHSPDMLFVAQDGGQLFTLNLSGTIKAAGSMCSTSASSCNATFDQVWSLSYGDVTGNGGNGYLYFNVANKVLRVNGFTNATYGCSLSSAGTCSVACTGNSCTGGVCSGGGTTCCTQGYPTCDITRSPALDSTVLRNASSAVPDYQNSGSGAVALYSTYRGKLYQLDPANSMALQTVTASGLGKSQHEGSGTFTRSKTMNTESATQHNWGTGASAFSCPFSSPFPVGQDTNNSGHYLTYSFDCDGYVTLFDSTGLNNLTDLNSHMPAYGPENAWTGDNGNDINGMGTDNQDTVTCNVIDSFALAGSQGMVWTCGLSSGGVGSGGSGSAFVQFPSFAGSGTF
jgi:hypothetical protein